MEGQSTRPDRVGEEFREILAEEIPKLKDPRVGFVTVLGVTVTPDLRKALVHFSALGDEPARRRTRAGLESAKKHLRAALGHQVHLKFTPELRFEEVMESGQGTDVLQLIDRLSWERQRAEEGESDAN